MTSDIGEAAPLVRLTVEGGVATVLLDSPHNRNALSARLRTELAASLDGAVADDDARVILLTHTGPVFCAGADLKEPAAGGTPATRIFEALWDSPKPTVAKLGGGARAGGVGLVAACDFAVAAEDVTFAFTEVRIGVVPAVISVLLRERMAPAVLHELFLTGRSFDARRAADTGLLSAAVPRTRLDAEVDELVCDLLLGAPGALATTKRLMREPGRLNQPLEQMRVLSEAVFASEEGREGMRAFGEKRPPRWVSGGTPPAPTS